MQASLADYPPTDPPEATYKYQALNAVGVALMIKGDVLLEKGNKAGSLETYKTLADEFGYGQFQDVDGKWLKLGEVAREKLADIRGDTN